MKQGKHNLKTENLELSIIQPMYNEEQVIRESVTCLINAMKDFPLPWELILVNDGSTDSTLEIIDQMVHDNKSLKIISRSEEHTSELQSH